MEKISLKRDLFNSPQKSHPWGEPHHPFNHMIHREEVESAGPTQENPGWTWSLRPVNTLSEQKPVQMLLRTCRACRLEPKLTCPWLWVSHPPLLPYLLAFTWDTDGRAAAPKATGNGSFYMSHLRVTLFSIIRLLQGLPWWSSGWDSALEQQGAPVQFLVGELDPTCRS